MLNHMTGLKCSNNTSMPTYEHMDELHNTSLPCMHTSLRYLDLMQNKTICTDVKLT